MYLGDGSSHQLKNPETSLLLSNRTEEEIWDRNGLNYIVILKPKFNIAMVTKKYNLCGEQITAF